MIVIRHSIAEEGVYIKVILSSSKIIGYTAYPVTVGIMIKITLINTGQVNLFTTFEGRSGVISHNTVNEISCAVKDHHAPAGAGGIFNKSTLAESGVAQRIKIGTASGICVVVNKKTVYEIRCGARITANGATV